MPTHCDKRLKMFNKSQWWTACGSYMIITAQAHSTNHTWEFLHVNSSLLCQNPIKHHVRHLLARGAIHARMIFIDCTGRYFIIFKWRRKQSQKLQFLCFGFFESLPPAQSFCWSLKNNLWNFLERTNKLMLTQANLQFHFVQALTDHSPLRKSRCSVVFCCVQPSNLVDGFQKCFSERVTL